MPDHTSTYWTLIRRAAGGSREARDEFARRYERIVRPYFGARWRGTPLASEAEDAVQEVFLECFKENGALGRVESGRPGGFRAYLYGVIRNTAQDFERKRARRRAKPMDSSFRPDAHASDERSLASTFDRSWARAMVRQAGVRQAEIAAETNDDGARRRVKLLNLRFHEGLPIREIARIWNEDAQRLHREYRRARIPAPSAGRPNSSCRFRFWFRRPHSEASGDPATPRGTDGRLGPRRAWRSGWPRSNARSPISTWEGTNGTAA